MDPIPSFSVVSEIHPWQNEPEKTFSAVLRLVSQPSANNLWLFPQEVKTW
jgi:hypothetical protein